MVSLARCLLVTASFLLTTRTIAVSGAPLYGAKHLHGVSVSRFAVDVPLTGVGVPVRANGAHQEVVRRAVRHRHHPRRHCPSHRWRRCHGATPATPSSGRSSGSRGTRCVLMTFQCVSTPFVASLPFLCRRCCWNGPATPTSLQRPSSSDSAHALPVHALGNDRCLSAHSRSWMPLLTSVVRDPFLLL